VGASPVTIRAHPQAAGVYVLETEIWLPQCPETVFPFFGEALNLEAITPPSLHFQVLKPQPIQMRAGALIDYRLRLRGVPLRWRTEIAAWDPPHRFVDRQLSGPYRRWVHEHTFQPQGEGTLVRDRVEYAPRGGGLLHRWFVRPELQRIFAFRQCTLQALFGISPVAISPVAGTERLEASLPGESSSG
jgi:ligand-binding SRPBCC domain-containing protein